MKTKRQIEAKIARLQKKTTGFYGGERIAIWAQVEILRWVLRNK